MSDQEKEEGLTTGGLKTGGLKTGSLSDRPENSNIKQAAPMSGLQTGSVKDHIAEQYEPALSGSEGPRARFDTLRELINTEIGSYESGKVVSSPGSDSLTGFGQFKTLRVSRRRGQAAAIPEDIEPVYSPWDLVAGESANTFDLVLGDLKIDRGYDYFSVTIVDFEGLSLSAGKVLYLEIDTDTPSQAVVKVATSWSGMPIPYQYDEIDGSWIMEFYRFPIWQFFGTSGNDPLRVSLGNDIWGKKLCNFNLQILWGVWEQRTTGGDVVVPLVGAPYFAAASGALLI